MMNKYNKLILDILSLAEDSKQMYVEVEILGAKHLIDIMECSTSVDDEGDLILRREGDFYGNGGW
jgi:hypothetical protein